MDEQTSLTTYSETKPEPRTEDCVEYFNRRKTGQDIYRDRANGDDAGHIEYIEEEIDDARSD